MIPVPKTCMNCLQPTQSAAKILHKEKQGAKKSLRPLEPSQWSDPMGPRALGGACTLTLPNRPEPQSPKSLTMTGRQGTAPGAGPAGLRGPAPPLWAGKTRVPEALQPQALGGSTACPTEHA